MRDQGSGLKSKLRENAARYDSLRKERDNELTGLRKETESFAKKIRQLERENSRQAQRLQAKEAEVARLASGQGQHRGSRVGVSGRGSVSSSFGRPSSAPVRAGGGGSARSTPGRHSSRPGEEDETEGELQKRLTEQKSMLDAEVEKHMVREDATNRCDFPSISVYFRLFSLHFPYPSSLTQSYSILLCVPAQVGERVGAA